MNKFNELFEQEMNSIGGLIENFPWENKNLYCNWLSQTAYFVSHSSRLLSRCASSFGSDQQTFHMRFVKHAAEEMGHERLAEKDLKSFGKKLTDFKELTETSNFYAYQYYGIDFISPIHFLGYVFLLEGIAVRHGAKAEASVTQAHGNLSSSFLRVHSNEDPGHLKQAFSILESLSDKELEIASKSLAHSSKGYSSILSSICASETGSSVRRVAV